MIDYLFKAVSLSGFSGIHRRFLTKLPGGFMNKSTHTTIYDSISIPVIQSNFCVNCDTVFSNYDFMDKCPRCGSKDSWTSLSSFMGKVKKVVS